jgi:hypothetical protein
MYLGIAKMRRLVCETRFREAKPETVSRPRVRMAKFTSELRS